MSDRENAGIALILGLGWGCICYGAYLWLGVGAAVVLIGIAVLFVGIAMAAG